MSRESILHKVRTALGRNGGQEPGAAPAVRLRIPEVEVQSRIDSLLGKAAALAAKTKQVATPAEAQEYVAAVVDGRSAVAANDPFLAECGVPELPGVRSGFTNREELRECCATAAVGITSADYALADTGTLVMLSSRDNARLISLLPPVHVAVLPKSRILTGLDELFTLLPHPAEQTASMVLITGPSRTADIEQILVRGVHGPGEIHIVVVG